MEHFFLPELSGDRIRVEGDPYRHLTRSRRLAMGDQVIFSDGRGTDHRAEMVECTREAAVFRILDSFPSETECGLKISLFQCLPKQDKMEEVLHRCTPLGVTRFVPVLSSRVIGGKPNENKQKRWEKIVLSAATQSGRSILPEIAPCCSFQEAIEQMKEADLALICYENATEPLPVDLPKEGHIAILVGPEGGLAPEEAAQLPCISLGKRILRTEDAAAFLLPILLDRSGNLY